MRKLQPVSTLLTCLLGIFAAFWLSPAASAATCSLATVSGSYAVATIGQQSGVFQSEVFRMTSDGNGNLSGTGAESLNGTIHTGVTINGTYTVASNCSFTSTTTDSLGNTFAIAGNIAQAGGQITGISTTSAELQFSAYKMHSTSCTQASGAGSYTFQNQSPLTAFGPAIQTGELNVNQQGKGGGSSVGNFSGTIIHINLTATATINSDCTFTTVTKNSNGTTATSFGVGGIYQNDVALLYVGIDSGDVTLGIAYKQ